MKFRYVFFLVLWKNVKYVYIVDFKYNINGEIEWYI